MTTKILLAASGGVMTLRADVASSSVTFNKDVLPVLQANCQEVAIDRAPGLSPHHKGTYIVLTSMAGDYDDPALDLS